jgi:hypothetical protein
VWVVGAIQSREDSTLDDFDLACLALALLWPVNACCGSMIEVSAQQSTCRWHAMVCRGAMLQRIRSEP